MLGLPLALFSIGMVTWGLFAKKNIFPIIGLLMFWVAILSIFVPHFWR